MADQQGVVPTRVKALATPAASAICAMAGRVLGSAASFGGPTKARPVDSLVRYTSSKPSKVLSLSGGRLGRALEGATAVQSQASLQKAEEAALESHLKEQQRKKRAELAEMEKRKKIADAEAAEQARRESEQARARAEAAAAVAALAKKRREEENAKQEAALKARQEQDALAKKREELRRRQEEEKKREEEQERQRLKAENDRKEKARLEAQVRRQRRLALWWTWKSKVSTRTSRARCEAMALQFAMQRRRERIAVRRLALNRWRRACQLEKERRERARRRIELIRSTIVGLDVNRALEPLFPSSFHPLPPSISFGGNFAVQVPQHERRLHEHYALAAPWQQEDLRQQIDDYDAYVPSPLHLAAIVGHVLLAATADAWSDHRRTMLAIKQGQHRVTTAFAASKFGRSVAPPLPIGNSDTFHRQEPPTTFWKLLLVPVNSDAQLEQQQGVWRASPHAVVDWVKSKLTPSTGLSEGQRIERMESLKRIREFGLQVESNQERRTMTACAAAGVLALHVSPAAVLREEIRSDQSIDDDDTVIDDDMSHVEGVRDTDDAAVYDHASSLNLPPLGELRGKLALCVRECPVPQAAMRSGENYAPYTALLEQAAMHGTSAVVVTLEHLILERHADELASRHTEAGHIKSVVQSVIDAACSTGKRVEFPLLIVVPAPEPTTISHDEATAYLARQLLLDDLPRASASTGGILAWRIVHLPLKNSNPGCGPSAVSESAASRRFAQALRWLAAKSSPAPIVSVQSLTDVVSQAQTASLAEATLAASAAQLDSSSDGENLRALNSMVDALTSSLYATSLDIAEEGGARLSAMASEESWWPPSEFRHRSAATAARAFEVEHDGVIGVPGAAVLVDGTYSVSSSARSFTPTFYAGNAFLPLDWDSSARAKATAMCLRGLALPHGSQELVNMMGNVWLGAAAEESISSVSPTILETYICDALLAAEKSCSTTSVVTRVSAKAKASAGASAVISFLRQSGEQYTSDSRGHQSSLTCVPRSIWNGLAQDVLSMILSQCLAVMLDATPPANRVVFRSCWDALARVRDFVPRYAMPARHLALTAEVQQSGGAVGRRARGDNIMAVMTALATRTKRMRIGSSASSSAASSSISTRNRLAAPFAVIGDELSNSGKLRTPLVEGNNFTAINIPSSGEAPSLGETTAAIIATARKLSAKRARADVDSGEEDGRASDHSFKREAREATAPADTRRAVPVQPLRFEATQETAANTAFEEQLRALTTCTIDADFLLPYHSQWEAEALSPTKTSSSPPPLGYSSGGAALQLSEHHRESSAFEDRLRKHLG